MLPQNSSYSGILHLLSHCSSLLTLQMPRLIYMDTNISWHTKAKLKLALPMPITNAASGQDCNMPNPTQRTLQDARCQLKNYPSANSSFHNEVDKTAANQYFINQSSVHDNLRISVTSNIDQHSKYFRLYSHCSIPWPPPRKVTTRTLSYDVQNRTTANHERKPS
jgi:hypothetical protein